MTKSFCFLSKKGGVGKTTFSLNCAHALAFSRFRTLLVDMDGQANLTRHLLKGAGTAEHMPNPGSAVPAGFPDISHVLLKRCAPHEAILTTGYENLDLLAGSTSLDDLPILDPRLIREPARFKLILQELAPDYDFILVDCPPIVNWLTRMVLFAVEGVIVPIQAEPYALQGLQDLIPMLDKMTATAQLFKIVVNMYRANTQLHQNILKEINEEFPGRIARQKVRQTIQLAEAAREGLSIFEYAPTSIGALDLYALCFELFELSPEKVKQNVLARGAEAHAQAAAELDTPMSPA
ncbi:MAG: ParA family protein [Fibrobacterota bacterium]|nr:ParA family protein [Fibrobacterota bacterium]